MKVKIEGIVYAELRPEFQVEEIVENTENEICDLAAEFKLKISLWKNGWIMSQELAEYFAEYLTVENGFKIDDKEDAKELWENEVFSDDVFYYELLPQIEEFFD